MRFLCALLAMSLLPLGTVHAQQYRGANVIQTTVAPWGTPDARESMRHLREIGANTIAIVPFLFQPTPASDSVSAGDALTRSQLRAALSTARELHLHVLLKPHVWVPGTWAGAVALRDSAAWKKWFASYSTEILALAAVAQEESVDALAVGVELRGTVDRPEWRSLIARVRSVYKGRLTFVADNVEQVARVPFWNQLDFISLSLYPGLGKVADDGAMAAHMSAALDSLSLMQHQIGKPVWIAEVGIRSAAGAQEEPWISPEERAAPEDQTLQARVTALWLDAIERRPWIESVLIWRWFTDPRATSHGDTDFTVQGKTAEGVLLDRWRMRDASHK